MINIQSNYTALDRELDRVSKLPDFKTKVALEAVLKEAYVSSQARVHVRTGSLKSSGRIRSHEGEEKWTGEMEYGGPSAGVNNPVDYAIYEKRREEDHDFLANVHLLHNQWIAAMKTGLS